LSRQHSRNRPRPRSHPATRSCAPSSGGPASDQPQTETDCRQGRHAIELLEHNADFGRRQGAVPRNEMTALDVAAINFRDSARTGRTPVRPFGSITSRCDAISWRPRHDDGSTIE
jgi:hypothetical protein